MNQHNNRYNFNKVPFSRNFKCEREWESWMNHQRQVAKYLVWINTTKDYFALENLEYLAIQNNNLMVLEMCWQYPDRCIPPNYSQNLHMAILEGNVSTFLHCLYAYNNYSVEEYQLDYWMMREICKDQDVKDLLSQFRDVINGKFLPSTYNDNIEIAYPVDNEEKEFFKKLALYRQIIQSFRLKFLTLAINEK